MNIEPTLIFITFMILVVCIVIKIYNLINNNQWLPWRISVITTIVFWISYTIVFSISMIKYDVLAITQLYRISLTLFWLHNAMLVVEVMLHGRDYIVAGTIKNESTKGFRKPQKLLAHD